MALLILLLLLLLFGICCLAVAVLRAFMYMYTLPLRLTARCHKNQNRQSWVNCQHIELKLGTTHPVLTLSRVRSGTKKLST